MSTININLLNITCWKYSFGGEGSSAAL